MDKHFYTNWNDELTDDLILVDLNRYMYIKKCTMTLMFPFIFCIRENLDILPNL